jgi:hypothetical protein
MNTEQRVMGVHQSLPESRNPEMIRTAAICPVLGTTRLYLPTHDMVEDV